MFATKTIYTYNEWLGIKDIIASVVSGFALSFAFVAYLLRYMYASTLVDGSTLVDASSTSDTESEELEDTEEHDEQRKALLTFQNRYYDELEALTEHEVSVERRKELSTIYLQELTPDGEIVLSYDDRAEAFRYYSDSFLKVSYQTLDALARKFAVLYNCKALCINARQELLFAQEKIEKERQNTIKQLDNPQPQPQSQPQPRSIFAKFKKYDKTTTSNIKQVDNLLSVPIPVPKRSNRFIYKGNLLAAKVDIEFNTPSFAITTTRPEPPTLETTDALLAPAPTPALATAPAPAPAHALALGNMDYATFKRLVLNQ